MSDTFYVKEQAWHAWKRGKSVTDNQIKVLFRSLQETLHTLTCVGEPEEGIVYSYLKMELRKIEDLANRRNLPL